MNPSAHESGAKIFKAVGSVKGTNLDQTRWVETQTSRSVDGTKRGGKSREERDHGTRRNIRCLREDQRAPKGP